MAASKGTPMTVAVGFTCDDGLVLAVDSEISDGVARFDGDKAWFWSLPDEAENPLLKIAVVGSGDLAFIRYAAERIRFGLRVEMNRDDVQSVIQGVVSDIHINHLYPYPEAADRPVIDLLIAIRAPDGRRLLSTSLTTVSKVWNYNVVGTGSTLANFLIKRFLGGRFTVGEAAFLSAHVLFHVKRNILRCGGRTRIFVMYNDSHVAGFLRDDAVQEYEQYAERFEALIRPVLLNGSSDHLNAVEFANQVDSLAEQLKRLRPLQLEQVANVSQNIVIEVPTRHMTMTGQLPSVMDERETPLPLRASDGTTQEEK